MCILAKKIQISKQIQIYDYNFTLIGYLQQLWRFHHEPVLPCLTAVASPLWNETLLNCMATINKITIQTIL